MMNDPSVTFGTQEKQVNLWLPQYASVLRGFSQPGGSLRWAGSLEMLSPVFHGMTELVCHSVVRNREAGRVGRD